MNLILITSVSYALSLSSLFGFGGPKNIVDRVQRSIVSVTYEKSENDHMSCTGFVINSAKGQVLTASHCVADLDVVQVDGVDSLVIEKGETLALLSIIPMSRPSLDIQKDNPSIGDQTQTFGFGWGTMKVLTRHVAGFTKEGSDIIIDGPLIPGMSGGPVIDAHGKVVGINMASNDIVGVLCGAQEIREFLKSK